MRFVRYSAPTLETLLERLNTENTMFSVVVFFGKVQRNWVAVLDFAFQPVITPDLIAEAQEDDRATTERLMSHFNKGLIA